MNESQSTNLHHLRHSLSVSKVVAHAGVENATSAAALAQTVFAIHGEYAGDKAALLTLKDTPTRRMTGEWLAEIELLFDPDRIRSFADSEASLSHVADRPELPTLHGRLLVIGLCLLKPRLRAQLESADAFGALVKELREPLPEILTERGWALYESPGPAEERHLYDSVPSWPDDPLVQPDQDLLGRAAFARFLAKRIAAVEPKCGAYSIHVYGPCGAGKSSPLHGRRGRMVEVLCG